mgnify:CR=1 FL=1
MKILIAENEETTLDLLAEILRKEGFEVITSTSGEQALKRFNESKPDFVCLDIMMDGVSGYDVCREIRKFDEHTPIIFITAKSSTIDKVLGLELGADDYILKPFEFHEVIARIRAVVRRNLSAQLGGKVEEFFQMNELAVFPNKLQAWKHDIAIDLSLRETKLLKLLHENKNKAVDRDSLIDECWGIDTMPDSRIIDWHIAKLRKKIETTPSEPKIIKTIPRQGYMYEQVS